MSLSIDDSELYVVFYSQRTTRPSSQVCLSMRPNIAPLQDFYLWPFTISRLMQAAVP